MLLNGTIKCGGYRQMGRSWWQLSLSDTTIEEVAALTAPYEVYEDDGETLVASFADYVKDGVNLGTEEGSVRLDIVRELPAESKNAIETVEANLSALTTRVTATEATTDEAKEVANEASSHTTQFAALATMQVATMDLTEATSTDCVGFRDYWPEWKPDTEYGYQQPLRHKGLYYRASKALTSSAVYPPDTAGESEYYPVEVAPDGIIVYRTCHGQYDQVQAGETRHYPDADGPVYRAKVDTAYDPDTYPAHWELAQE